MTMREWARLMTLAAVRNGDPVSVILHWVWVWLTSPETAGLAPSKAPRVPEAEVNTWTVDEVQA